MIKRTAFAALMTPWQQRCRLLLPCDVQPTRLRRQLKYCGSRTLP